MTLARSVLDEIAPAIARETGDRVRDYAVAAVGGGDINAAYRLNATGRAYFVKTNRAGRLPMFEAEAQALADIAATRTVRVPAPVCCGVAGGSAYLVLEWLDMHPLHRDAAARLGRELAALHSHTRTDFGWRIDNTIGATPQPNSALDDWPAFWKKHRFGFQLELAARNGYCGRLEALGNELLARCDHYFAGHHPSPSLLHGDLWSGNAACLASGEPVIFDPATYYGDREADLAMTELFGGFPREFMAAYTAEWPLADGYGLRGEMYNLYHLLNHLNLFGRGYLARCEAVIERLLAARR